MNYFKRDRYRFLNKDAQYMGCVFDFSYLANHPDPEIAKTYIELMTDNYNETKPDIAMLTKLVTDAIHHLKLKYVLRLIRINSQSVKDAAIAGIEISPLLEERMLLDSLKMKICKELGIDVIK